MPDQVFTAADLIAWRKRLGLTQAQAADLLGVSRRTYQYRENGTTPILNETALACRQIEAEMGPSAPAEEFDIDLGARRVTHRPTGCEYSFYDYPDPDDLISPAMVRNPRLDQSIEIGLASSLVRGATQAYRKAKGLS